MKNQEDIAINKSIFVIPTAFVILIWLVYWIEIQFNLNFNKYGLFPRSFSGFKGVFLMHFIHGDTNHLFNNSIPLFVLLSSLFSFYKEAALKVLLIGGVLTGLLTWVFARDSYHIGASGIVYLLFSFVFFSGIIRKHFRLVALSLIIIFLYGSMIWYVLPIRQGVSWEGHLSGFVIGLFIAILFRKKGIVREEHVFSTTDFDLLFDEDGNFIPPKVEEELIDKIDQKDQ